MPVPAKSYLPAFAAFLALGVTYTTVAARKEGNTIDAARSRWQNQKARADAAISSYGASTLEHHQ